VAAFIHHSCSQRNSFAFGFFPRDANKLLVDSMALQTISKSFALARAGKIDYISHEQRCIMWR